MNHVLPICNAGKERVNSLFPSSLYDSNFDPGQVTAILNPSSPYDHRISVNPTGKPKPKITSFSVWLEAWNIYIQAMVRFHPKLAKDLISYEEANCNFQCIYPAQAWLKYDAAFRMALGLDKGLSWARTDEYAFNKILRCSVASPNPTAQHRTFLRCSSQGHIASNSPKQTNFRPFAQHSSNPRPSVLPNTNIRRPGYQPEIQGSQPTCCLFNNNQCFRSGCPYDNKCPKCFGNHLATNCRLVKQL